jgi:hypothetical protein
MEWSWRVTHDKTVPHASAMSLTDRKPHHKDDRHQVEMSARLKRQPLSSRGSVVRGFLSR